MSWAVIPSMSMALILSREILTTSEALKAPFVFSSTYSLRLEEV